MAMALSCDCYLDFDGDEDWYYQPPEDYQVFSESKRKRCSSCRTLIEIGACCTEFTRAREARTEIEQKIYGEGDHEAIPLASYWLCEECSDLYFSLTELGFQCISPDESMKELVSEYAAVWGPRKH